MTDNEILQTGVNEQSLDGRNTIIAPSKPSGPYHHFWLFRDGEREYSNYQDLLGRKDAPITIPDDILRYFHDWWEWLTPINPSGDNGSGWNYCGTTIIERETAGLLRQI